MQRLLLLSLCLLMISFVAATPAWARPVADGVSWRPLYEPGCGGWITSIRVSPHDPNRVLIGGDMLGIGLSTDRGDSWTPARGLPSYEIGDFTWHPTEPFTVWAGTMSGPVLSTDGGATWTLRRDGFPVVQAGTYASPVERVLFDPNDSSRLIAVGGSSRGWEAPKGAQWGQIHESRDGGKTWSLVGQIVDAKGDGQNIRSMAFAAGSSSRLYAGGLGVGLRVSNDGGRTWADRSAGLPSREVERVVADRTKPGTLWVSLSSGPAASDGLRVPGGIFRSDDAGESWVPLLNGLSQARAKDGNHTANYKGFDVSPSDPQHMVTSDGSWDRGGVYTTTDGGQSWKLVASRTNIGKEGASTSTAAFEPQTAYFAGIAQTVASFDPTNSNVIFTAGSEFALRTLDGGKTWNDSTALQPDPSQPAAWRGRGYSGLCSIWFAWHPKEPGRAFLLAMDAGKLWQSRDGLKSWTYHGHQPWPWGGGNDVSIAGDYIYATFGQHGSFQGIGVSSDGGKTFAVMSGTERGLPKHGSGGEPKGVYAFQKDPRKAWATVGDKLLVTTDGGASWARVDSVEGKAFFIAADPNRAERFFVTGETGVWLTEDAGATFTNIGGPRSTWRSRLVVDVKGRLLVASWRGGGNTNGLWRYDAGTWTRLLDESHAFCPSVDATDSTRIALSTSDDPFHDISNATGVWISADDGKTWTNASEGLGMLRGQVVAINPHDPEQLVFGSFGGGFYEGRWPKSYRPIGSRSYASSAADAAAMLPQSAEASAVPASAGLDDAAKPKLKNGSFDRGEDVPTGWDKTDGAKLSRDTNTFKKGPASLKITVDNADGHGLQELSLKAGTKVRLKGYVKSEGSAKVSVFVMSFNQSGGFLKFDQLRYVQNDTDWQSFDREVELPAETARCSVGVMAQGTGSAWLDEVQLQINGEDANADDAGVKADEKSGEPGAAAPATKPAEEWRHEPAKGLPNTPAWGFYPKYPTGWIDQFRDQRARSKKGGVDVVFLGDSLTQGWGGAGKDVWKQKFAPLKAANYGIGGDSTRQVLYRLENGLLDGIQPKVVVLMIGTNNLYGDFNAGTDEQIADGIKACVERIRAKAPTAKVLLLSLLPRQNDYFNGRIERINKAIAKLDDGDAIKFVDVTEPFAAEKPVKKELYDGDLLHLGTKGYEALADRLAPVMEPLVK